MTTSNFEDDLFLRYLRLLGIQKDSPGLTFLKNIIQTHTSKIPFENISKLYYKKQHKLNKLINFEIYLDGIENYGFGGTCYSMNFYLNRLLSWLGYDIKLCGAAMKKPDVHLVSVISLEDREFLVDAGYAAPFSEPLSLDLPYDYSIAAGSDRYVIKPQTNNCNSRIELIRNGELIHGYRINPKPRIINEFQDVITRSFDDNATFMNAILLSRFDNNHFIMIHNMTFIESFGNESKKTSIGTFEQLCSIINDRFFIPKSIISESIDSLQMQRNAWS